jgi:hypothetical protein
MTQYLEQYDPEVLYAGGLNTLKPATFGSTIVVTGLATFQGGTLNLVASASGHSTTAAINATATATAAQVQTGYITSTSAAATTITLPTGTSLGTQLGASQGTIFTLYVDNTAGANTVTMAVNTNAILSALAVANSASFGLLTIPSGVTGTAEFRLIFSSATAYTFTRVA